MPVTVRAEIYLGLITNDAAGPALQLKLTVAQHTLP